MGVVDGRGLLDCKVEGYSRLNDGSLADEHMFRIRIWCERTYTYEIVRTAGDLVALSQSLLKRFPRAGLRPVPIQSSVRNRRQLALGGGVGKTLRHSRTSTTARISIVSDSQDAESMAHYKQSVEVWLRALLTIPEVVGSEDLVAWLADDDSVDFEDDESLVTRVDFALEDEPVQRGLVRHGHSFAVNLQVPRGHFVVWSFASQPRDVAFSLECDGKEARTYERVPSHERLFQGVWENSFQQHSAGEDGVDIDALLVKSQVTVRWGNEYAKWRDKKLFYQVAVLSKDALEIARRRYRAKVEAEAERDAHREALERVAKKLSRSFDAASPSGGAPLDEFSPQSGGDAPVSTEGSTTTTTVLPETGDEWRALPRRELEAVAMSATKKAEALSEAMARLEAETSAASIQRDDALSEASACRARAEEAESRASANALACTAESREKQKAVEAERAARAQLIEVTDAAEKTAEQLRIVEAQLESVRRERDLLAEAARGYKDSAELARGDAKCVRDELASARDALAFLHNDPKKSTTTNGDVGFDDDDDDLLERVDALQSRIDNELGKVKSKAASSSSSNNHRKKTTSTTSAKKSLLNHNPPPPRRKSPMLQPPPPAKAPSPAPVEPPPTGRRHDLVVQAGYGPGDEMPFRVEGMDLSVVIPNGLRTGDTFTIELR